MPIEEYVVDQPVKIQGFFFADPDESAPTDVATATLTVKTPTSGDNSYSSPSHDGVGKYSEVVVPDEPGDWHYRWDTTNPVCVVQGLFTVYERNV